MPDHLEGHREENVTTRSKDSINLVRRSVRLKKTATRRSRELMDEAQAEMDRAGEEKLGRLRELVDDCMKILDILETNSTSGEKHFWSVYEKYAWAKGPGKGETASLWYKMRLYALRLWDESSQILK